MGPVHRPQFFESRGEKYVKPKGSGSKWNSFVAPDETNNTVWAAVTAINEALKAGGLNVTRVSIIQASGIGGMGGAEEMHSHEFLADKSFPVGMGLNFYGDFQEHYFRQFNYGDLLELLRNTVPNRDAKNLPAAILPWLRQCYDNVYSVGNTPGQPGIPYVYEVRADSAILNANPDAVEVIVERVLPFITAALEADGGL